MRSFSHSTSVLIKAYLNDTLIHSKCSACAVGNLVAEAMGKTNKRKSHMCFDDGSEVAWLLVFMTDFPHQKMDISAYEEEPEARRQIDSTGYTVSELARIEYAFESAKLPVELQELVDGDGYSGLNDEDLGNDEWMFNGLVAVFEVLANIHGVDLTTKTEALEALQLVKAPLQ
jgi:hypothetical protein